jgi:hypothetical protein
MPDRNPQSQEGTVPELVEAVAKARFEGKPERTVERWDDLDEFLQNTWRDEAAGVVEATQPVFEKHLADRLKEVERQREEAQEMNARLNSREAAHATEAAHQKQRAEEFKARAEQAEKAAGERLEQVTKHAKVANTRGEELAATKERAREAEAALAERDEQVREAAEKLDRLGAEARRAADSGLPNYIAEHQGACDGYETSAAILRDLTQPSSTPLQQDHETSIHPHEPTGGAVARCTCGWTGTIHNDRGTAEQQAYDHRSSALQQEPEVGEGPTARERELEAALRLADEALTKHPLWCGYHRNAPGHSSFEKAMDAISAARLTQPEADPEVPGCGPNCKTRCGGTERVCDDHHDRRCACPTCPDCQSTPELLGEEGRQREFRIVGVGSSGEERVLANPSTDEEWIEKSRDFLEAGDTYRDVREQFRDVITTRTPWRDQCDCDPDGRIARECCENGCRADSSTQPESPGNGGEVALLRQAAEEMDAQAAAIEEENAPERSIGRAIAYRAAANRLRQLVSVATQPVPGNSGGVEEGGAGRLSEDALVDPLADALKLPRPLQPDDEAFVRELLALARQRGREARR